MPYGDAYAGGAYGDAYAGGAYGDEAGYGAGEGPASSAYGGLSGDYQSAVTARSADEDEMDASALAPAGRDVDPAANRTPATAGSYGDFGAAYGDDATLRAAASPRPGAASNPVVDPPQPPAGLSAWVLDVKEPTWLGRLRGEKVVAKVEVVNAGERTLTGRVRVRFLDSGDPTGVIQTRAVTLAPKEKQTLVFTAAGSRLDDAEASIEQEAAETSQAGVVIDRTPSTGRRSSP
ncbi:MAG: hypothetical protein VKP62_00400 [Candidatus Sericytochromatia bacterium]|nr:hypothetical protein [Candidatus Sericytochromatia bacterium]